MFKRQRPLVLTESEPETRSTSLENPSVSLDDPKAFYAFFNMGFDNLTNETLNRDIVYGIPAVKAAVNRISDAIASIDLHYYTDDPVKGRTKATSDPLYSILNHIVDKEAFLTSNRWRKRVAMDLCLDGRHVSRIRFNKAGRVHSIIPLPNDPNKLKIEIVNGVPNYIFKNGDKIEVLKPKDVLDFVWMPDGNGGHINPVTSNKDTFGLFRAAERYSAKMFANGGVPPYILTGAVAPSAAAAARANEDLKKALKHAAETGTPPTLPAGIDVKLSLIHI